MGETKRSEAAGPESVGACSHIGAPIRRAPAGLGLECSSCGALLAVITAMPAPAMRATLDQTAGSLAEIEVALGVAIDHLDNSNHCAAMESMLLIREAVASLLVNVKEG